jgi:myo-inositol-1(or 4)-monophosphatase
MNLEKICGEVVKISDEVKIFMLKEFDNFDKEKIEWKGVNNFVSYVDKTAEQMIVNGVRNLVADAGFIAEEGTGEEVVGGYNWVIDPLDGTTNFIHNIPYFSISIALVKGNDILVGVVNDVMHNTVYHAVKGGGAYANEKRISVSKIAKLADGVIATGFPYEEFGLLPNYMELLREMMQRSRSVRRLGSAAIDLAYVACGRFEAFYEYNLKPWDVAAGILLVQEAGGIVSDFSGGDDYLYGKELVAACQIHQELLSLINSCFR